MTTEKRSEKHELSRNSLPDNLKPVFDEIVADYRFSATKHHGSPFVSYVILADLVREGWRNIQSETPKSSQIPPEELNS